MLFSSRQKIKTTEPSFRANQKNKTNTIGRRYHRRNAQEFYSFPQRYLQGVADPDKGSFQRDESRESEHITSSVSTQQEGHDRSQVSSLQRSSSVCCLRNAVLLIERLCEEFCRARSSDIAGQGTHTDHRARAERRGIAWTLFMRQERGPRLDMELVDGSGKGVGEE